MKKILLALFILLLASCDKDSQLQKFANIPVFYGPEDILVDNSTSSVRILASCSARRSQYGSAGEIAAINLSDYTYTIMPRVGEPVGFSLHPHGFDIVTLSGNTYLYVIAHRPINDTGNCIVRYKVDADRLEFDKIYFHGLISSPNAIAVTNDGNFYFSNDGNESILNIILKPTNGTLIYGDIEGNMKIVDDGLRYPNGVAVNDKNVYLATVLGDAIYKYDIATENSLENKQKICSGYGWDNFRWYENNLIVARHTDISKFLLHYTDESKYSPFEVVEIDPSTGSEKVILKDDGSIISGVSTALVWEDKIFCGQIFEPYIVSFDKDF